MPNLPRLISRAGGRRAHDAGQAATAANRCVALAVNHPAVRIDLQLNDLSIFSAGKRFERQAATRTLRRFQRHEFMARGQVRLHGAAMTRRATPLVARGVDLAEPSLPFVARAEFGFAAKQALLQIPDAGLCLLHLSLQRRASRGSPCAFT
jgi:hypothetical protein